MFTEHELRLISQKLWEGVAPQDVAGEMEISYTTWRTRLMASGYRVSETVRRELTAINPVRVDGGSTAHSGAELTSA